MITNFIRVLESIFITDQFGNPGEIWQMLGNAGVKISYIFGVAAAREIVLYLVNYFFLAFGLFVMAKKRNLKNTWLAFIPFGQIFLMGKLIASLEIANVKMKHMGLIAMIVQIAAFGLFLARDILSLPVLTAVISEDFSLSGYAAFADAALSLDSSLAYKVVSYAYYFIGGAWNLFWYFLLFLVFSNYAPRSRFLFLVISVLVESFVGFSAGALIVFIIRNNSCEEYREYLKMKMHAMYGGGNPYDYDGGEYKDPYDLSKSDKDGKASDDKNQTPPDSPFDEYK